jgi:glutathione S-transferase
MSSYELLCFAQSGNAYRCALMLNLIGAKWKPVWVDFFSALVQRTPEFRANVNEMGEVPVLVIDGKRKLTQSAVILNYLAKQSGKLLPQGEDEELEALRWIVFDNQKTNGMLGPYRFLINWAKPAPDQAVLNFLKGRIDSNLAIVNKRLENMPYMLGSRPTIADVSMCAYLYYPADEYGFDIRKDHPAIAAWLDRIAKLPGWAHPYDLMPGHPFGTQLLNGKDAS